MSESEDGRRRTSDGTKDGERSEGSVLLPSLQTHSRERRNLGTLREKQNKTKTRNGKETPGCSPSWLSRTTPNFNLFV